MQGRPSEILLIPHTIIIPHYDGYQAILKKKSIYIIRHLGNGQHTALIDELAGAHLAFVDQVT